MRKGLLVGGIVSLVLGGVGIGVGEYLIGYFVCGATFLGVCIGKAYPYVDDGLALASIGGILVLVGIVLIVLAFVLKHEVAPAPKTNP